MDGNGRWAKKQNKDRIEGHKRGADTVRMLVTESRKLGIDYLTLYAFSTENWSRPQNEVNALMLLFEQFLKSELNLMLEKGIRLRLIGDRTKLPVNILATLNFSDKKNPSSNILNLNLAISYGSRQEILNACVQIAEKFKSNEIDLDEINQELFSSYLYTANMPDPDLLIRTSNEKRISNFLLWQIAYSEIYITDKLWPDFDSIELLNSLLDYSKRERRFGKVLD
ncbi:UNVERIFIED_CONTAM: hypothetical protein GTU68_049761 [Idotea baltica]|nr:hypothetical protein [Idotea baltica]